MNTEDLGSATLDPDPATTAIGAVAAMIPRGVNQGHSIGLLAAIFSCDRSSSSHHCCCDTPHCRQSTSRHVSQNDSRSHHRTRKQQYKPSRGSSWKSKDRKYKQVTINDSPSDHDSSDDSDRTLDDDLN